MKRTDAAGALACSLLLVLAGCAGVVGFGDGGTIPGEPTPSPFKPGDGHAFDERADELGLNYTVRPDGLENGGAYVLDYDGDGWSDLLAVGGHRAVLFENTGGEFERSGALPNVSAKSALVFDYDVDGDQDVLLLRVGDTPVLLENTGDGFERRDAGLDREFGFPIGATAADYDGDGCPDLFVIQYADWDDRRPVAAAPGMGKNISGSADNGHRNVLYQGTCGGFENVTSEAGIGGTRWSLATSFVDLTGDGQPDIHVANDFNDDILYVNEGDGTFTPRLLGGTTDRNAMSSEVADVNGDGHLDLFVTNVYVPREFLSALPQFEDRARGNNLLINRGNGTFDDRAHEYNVSVGGWGWAASITDFDNDGRVDLYHATQIVPIPVNVQRRLREEGKSVERYQRQRPWLGVPSFWEGTDDGFVRRPSQKIGFNLTSGTGVATLDIDNDGDRDIVTAQRSGEIRLYENLLETGNAVDVRVAGDGHVALGADVYATVDGETRRYVANAKADFISQDSRVIHVGLGDAESVELRVVWPDGHEVTVTVAADQRVVVGRDGTVETVAEH